MLTHESGRRQRRWSTAILLPALLIGTATACDDDDLDDDFDDGVVDSYDLYTDPYLYYYPVDLSYSSYYWADAWSYDSWYYQGAGQVQRQAIGDAIRALARGEPLCPGQVTVTPRSQPPACEAAGVSEIRSGARIEFDGCVLTSGATIDGTVDVTSSRSASEAVCGPSTRITLNHTTTLTDLSLRSAGGVRLVIPNQTDTGTNSYTYGQIPSPVSLTSSGHFQLFDASGNTTADFNHNGTRTVTFDAASRSYSVTGITTARDTRSGATATLEGTGITRTMDCCQPTAGTLTVTRGGGSSPVVHTWQFGPTCNQASFDGAPTTLPSCL